LCNLFNPHFVNRDKREEKKMNNPHTKTEIQMSKDLFPAEAWELISTNRENDLVIIDVSTPQEYRDLHLEGAINVIRAKLMWSTARWGEEARLPRN
jgi:hypothetical protein